MLNLKELEHKWLIYKIKSYLPFGIAFFIILIVAVFLVLSDSTTQPKKVETNSSITKQDVAIKKPSIDFLYKIENNKTKEDNNSLITDKKQVNLVVEKLPNKIEEKVVITPVTEQKTILEPSMGFMQTPTKTKVQTPKKEKQENLTIEPSMDFMQEIEEQPLGIIRNNKPKKTKPKPKHTEKKVVKTTHIQHKPIQIKRDSSKLDLKKLIKRFEKKKDPRLSLFIAEKFYADKKYKESHDYALITNQIDHRIEKSWIIFAKSLVKLGEKERAIKILQKYINYSKSNNAKLLLDDIKTRKFK